MQFLIWFIAIFVPVIPLSVLNFPWWGIALYTLLSCVLSLGAFINPIVFLWALFIEIRRIQSGRFDALSIIFFSSFCIYFAYWFLVYISTLPIRKLVFCGFIVLVIIVSVVSFVPGSSASLENNEITFKVAGVTFHNTNGTNRQQILADLMGVYGEWNPMPCRLIEYEYEGLPAYYVYVGTKIIGNIPADDVYKLKSVINSIEKSTVRISSFEEDGLTIYYAQVSVKLEK